MKIDRLLLDKIAHLARLEFDEKDADKIMQDMTTIVEWVEKLKEVDTEGVEPLTSMAYELNAFREDEPKNTLRPDEVLKNAPHHDDHFFRVPKVIE